MESKSLEEQKRELAQAYAKYLRENNLKPGDITFDAPEKLGEQAIRVSEELEERSNHYYEKDAAIVRRKTTKNKFCEPEDMPVAKNDIIVKEAHPRDKVSKRALKKTERKLNKKKEAEKSLAAKMAKEPGEGVASLEKTAAAPLFALDEFADKFADGFHKFMIRFFTATEKILTTYKNSRRVIGAAVLAVCILSAVMLVVFDKFTVYEYAYNGKTLGYVDDQEEVTNILEVAGDQLNEINTDSEQEIELVANDNISFKRVAASGKDTDDADTTVNKLAYMTDIEVEASGIYDNGRLVTVVKDEKTANRLLDDVKSILGTPDSGMELISVEFLNKLEIRPVNVLLTSVQSNALARRQMTKGGETKFYHLVEDEETLASICETFSVDEKSIYDENNKKQLSRVERGEKICVHKTVEPVSVKMVETGKMKETVPFNTIRQNSADYYIGDEVVAVEGVDGVQIFEGTVTKVGGKVTDRETISLEVLTEVVDRLILVGTTKRPKTAPTGTFHNPMDPGAYVVTSRPGWRWGRVHEGVDMGTRVGNSVYASDGGTVVRAGIYGGYGYCVDIDHGNGWISRYGHLSAFLVKPGDKVYQGQEIAKSGNSGRSTGPHLHFEIRKNGVFVNPDTKVVGGL